MNSLIKKSVYKARCFMGLSYKANSMMKLVRCDPVIAPDLRFANELHVVRS